jgi:lipid II:glycine glycyltransferase (peptidoglycan interpeptide bridge formation enzyme)
MRSTECSRGSSIVSDPPWSPIRTVSSLTVPRLDDLTGGSPAALPGAREMSVLRCYKLDPILDPRWTEFIERNPSASVFHTSEWLRALQATYGYEPVVFTTSSPASKLGNGMVFCHVRSWLTGHRMVSLPFSDYCEPLAASEELNFLVRYLQTSLNDERLKYVEFRPVNSSIQKTPSGAELHAVKKYVLHRLSLETSKEELFQNLDKDSVQRRIRRAGRAGLVEKCGRDEALLRDFYALLVTTRRRHQVPPQPYLWFQNLVKCFGDALEVRVAYKDQTAVASILTLRFKNTVYYKYGCSDASFNHLGATPLLLWDAISCAKSLAAQEFDLGRTDEDNVGLVAFKDKWGARSQPLVYSRFSGSPPSAGGEEWKLKVVKQVCSRLPERVLAAAGSLIYRHIG